MVPARAGVIPYDKLKWIAQIGGTRASGGDPTTGLTRFIINKWYPRERG